MTPETSPTPGIKRTSHVELTPGRKEGQHSVWDALTGIFEDLDRHRLPGLTSSLLATWKLSEYNRMRLSRSSMVDGRKENNKEAAGLKLKEVQDRKKLGVKKRKTHEGSTSAPSKKGKRGSE